LTAQILGVSQLFGGKSDCQSFIRKKKKKKKEKKEKKKKEKEKKEKKKKPWAL
jgi:hypothetical protein